MLEGDSDVLDPLAGRILGAGSNDLQRSIDSNTRVVQTLVQTLRKDGAPSPIQAWSTRSDGRQVLGDLRGKTTPAAPFSRMTTVIPPEPAQTVFPVRPATTTVASEVQGARPGVSLEKTGAAFTQPQPLRTTSVVPLTPTNSGRAARTSTVSVGFASATPTAAAAMSGAAGAGNGGAGVGLGKNSAPPPPPGSTAGANGGLVPPGGSGGQGGGGSSGWNWRNAAYNAGRISSKVGSWGAGLVRTGSVMDTYSQWAGIANAAPYSADGTNGGSVNNIRKFVFGSQGENLTGWAQSVKDAQAAAFIASRNSGFTELTPGSNNSINPQFAGYLGNIKDLSVLNPTLNASQTASTLGTLTSNRGLYAAQMYGYRPLLSPGGGVDRNALGGFTDSVMGRTFNGKTSIRPEELKASLGQNGSLHANIRAYVTSAGGDDTMVQAIEDYITGRNTAQQRGLSGNEFDALLSDYEKGGDAGRAAEKRLQKFGVSNTILQSQKDLSAAKSGNISDLMDSLGPAVKNANEALEKFYNLLDDIVNMPGVKQSVGTIAGWGSVFGSALGSGLGAAAGMRLGGGALSGAGSLLGLRAVMRAGGGGAAGAGALAGLGSRAGLLRAGAYGAGAVGLNAVGHAASNQSGNQGLRNVGNFLTTTGSYSLAGAGIGSVVPGLGTGVGALAGAGVGIVKGLWDGFTQDSTTGYDGRDGGGGNKGSKGSTPSSGGAITGKTAAGAIEAAMAQLGKPYLWGGTGPDAFDCSGLMQYAYKQIGVSLPRVSQDQMHVGKSVDRDDVRPGDLMFPYPGHVAMYIGGDKILEAPRPGKNIRVAPASEYGKYVAIRRIVGSVGSYSGGAEQDANTQKEQSGNLGGDSGSHTLSGDSVSTEEVDNIAAAIAGVQNTLLNTAMGASSDQADSDEESLSGDSPSNPSSAKDNIALGKKMAAGKGWTGSQWDALYRLWTGESNWNERADNPTSDAYGIPQALPGSKMASKGSDWKTNPRTQIAWGLDYIKGRYGNPLKAWNFWNSHNPHWYDTGAWEIPEDQHAVVHKGEMIIERPKADTIRQALMRDVVSMKDPTSGATGVSGGGGTTLNFHAGAVQFSVSGSMTAEVAQVAAEQFAKALEENMRMKSLAIGL